MFYLNIQIFIDDKLSEFLEVDVKYCFGVLFKFIMKDDKGNFKEFIWQGFNYIFKLIVLNFFFFEY